MNLHPALAIVNEAQLPEPVHDKVNPRPSCAHHLCQSLLTDFGNCNFGLSILAEVSKQEKNPSKSFLAGIEKLINQILFVSDVPCQQKCDEHFGKRMFPVKHFHHGLLIDSHHRAIGHCGCGAQAERLPYKATIFEKITLVQNAYCGFLPPPRHNGELHLSFLYVKKQHWTSRPEQRSSAFWEKLRSSYLRRWSKGMSWDRIRWVSWPLQRVS